MSDVQQQGARGAKEPGPEANPAIATPPNLPVVSGIKKQQGLTSSQQIGIFVTLVSSFLRSGVLALSMDHLDKLVVATKLSKEVILAAGCVVCLLLIMALKLLLDRVFGGSSSSSELSKYGQVSYCNAACQKAQETNETVSASTGASDLQTQPQPCKTFT